MLNSIMINLESPQKIHQKMVDLAPLHHRRAVSGAHMPIMGPLLISVFASIAGEHFTHEMRVGWEWFWEFMSRSMEMSLKDVGSTLNVVQTSWEDITERHSNEEIGRAMYAELFRTAPTLSAELFSTEKANDMASKMGDMLGLLVSHADDPTQLKQQVFWLGKTACAVRCSSTHDSVDGTHHHGCARRCGR
jgi:hemoglobin-like flavoprotein